MARFTRITRISACALGLTMLAGTAWAGPQITFGPDDKASLQIDYKGQFQFLGRDTGSGPNGDDSTYEFNFRRNRLAFTGAYGDNMELYVQTEYGENKVINTLSVAPTTSGKEFYLLDAVMRFKFNPAVNVYAGKFKYNFTREVLEACENPLTLDRSLFIGSPYTTTRDNGVAVWGNLASDMLQYRFDVMEGRGAGDPQTNAQAPESTFRYSFRAHGTFLDKENKYGYKGTYLGEKKVLTFGGAVQYEPNVAYTNYVDKTGKKDYLGWTVDGFYESKYPGIGTVTASAAYQEVNFFDAYKGANPDPGTMGLQGQKKGYYVKGGYMLPNLPLQFFGRFENWTFAQLNGIYDQKVDWFGLGANYYIRGQNLKLTFEYSYTNFDNNTATSVSSNKDFSTFITQLQLIF